MRSLKKKQPLSFLIGSIKPNQSFIAVQETSPSHHEAGGNGVDSVGNQHGFNLNGHSGYDSSADVETENTTKILFDPPG
jgi:hypothetical protein